MEKFWEGITLLLMGLYASYLRLLLTKFALNTTFPTCYILPFNGTFQRNFYMQSGLLLVNNVDS